MVRHLAGMGSEATDANDEVQMRSFWRRWNELVTAEPSIPEPHAPIPPFTAPVGAL